MGRREEGELVAFVLPLLSTRVSCAPCLFSHWCGMGGPACWRSEQGERCVCVCVCYNYSPIYPSGWVQVHIQSFKLFFCLYVYFFSQFFCYSLAVAVSFLHPFMRDSGILTEWIKLGTKAWYNTLTFLLIILMYKHCSRAVLLSSTNTHTHTSTQFSSNPSSLERHYLSPLQVKNTSY